MEVRCGCGARLGRSGCEQSKRGGGVWPEGAGNGSAQAQLDPSARKEKGRRKGNGASGKDKDELVRTPRFAATADAWRHRRSVVVWVSGDTVEHRR